MHRCIFRNKSVFFRKKVLGCNRCYSSRVFLKFPVKQIRCISSRAKQDILNGPSLKDFITETVSEVNYNEETVPYLDPSNWRGENRKVYIEVYGCQMNVNDAEIVYSILQGAGYMKANAIQDADVILILTCAIRDGAENKIWSRLKYLRRLKEYDDLPNNLKIGILGCMAERLKEKFLERERLVDLIAGPDSYKDLPRLLSMTRANQKAVNVLLSLDETYADVMPVRLNQDSVTAFVSIMRGCDNMCTYCIVPFTRGRERSRPMDSILEEVRKLSGQGIKEITLLGQNVNSYRDTSCETYTVKVPDSLEYSVASGFKTVYKPKKGGIRFAELLDKVSNIDPEIRIRFTSPHPKDFPDQVLELIKERSNICKCIHLPVQSGNSVVLERMRRGYTREAYLELVEKVKQMIPNISLTSDFIAGFCGEMEEQFQETLSIMRLVKYTVAYTFAYSMREKTTAHRRYKDDVPNDVKIRRVNELGTLFREIAEDINREKVGQSQLMLVEGPSRKSKSQLAGRTDCGVKVIIDEKVASSSFDNPDDLISIKPGDYVSVKITEANSQIFKGIPMYHTTLQQYYQLNHNSSFDKKVVTSY